MNTLLKTLFATILISLSFLQNIDAQAPKFSNEFLSLGVGARAQGMSNAVVASVSDGTSAYWNPAGLVNLQNFQLNAMHAEWFAGIAKYDFLSFSSPLRNRDASFGISIIRLGVDNIPYTFNLVDADGSINYDNVSPFSAADYAGLISYAQNWGDSGLSVGGNIKIIHRNIGRFAKAWGFGLDLGLQYQVPISDNSKWIFGLTARDVTSTFNAWKFSFTDEEKIILDQTGNDIPQSSVELTLPRIILGGGYAGQLSEAISLMAELDLDFTTDGKRNTLISSNALSIDPHMGLELGYKDYLFLRTGIGNIQKTLDDIDGLSESYSIQPNFGVGFRFNQFVIDYALTNIGNVSQVQYSHVFSLAINFKAKERKKKDNFFKRDQTNDTKRKPKKDKKKKVSAKKKEKVVEKKTATPKKGKKRPKVIEQIEIGG